MNKFVLVHGLPDHSGTWEHLLPLLAQSSNEIAIIGLPGIADQKLLNENQSFFEIAEQLIAKIPFKDAIYVGHDFGAIIGTLVASLKPDLISKLVLINGAAPYVLKEQISLNPDQAKRSSYAEKIVKSPEQTLTYNDYIFLKAYLFKEEIRASEKYKKSLLELWSKSLTQKNIGTYYRSFLSSNFKRFQFNQTTLQIWSDADPFIGPGVQSQMKNDFSNHHIVNLETDSHWPHLSHTGIVAQEIQKFLEMS